MISCKQTAIPRGWSQDDQSIGQPVTSHCLTMIWWGRWLVRLPRLGKWFGFTITFVQRPWVKRSRKVMGRAERLKPIHDLTRSGINELGVCGWPYKTWQCCVPDTESLTGVTWSYLQRESNLWLQLVNKRTYRAIEHNELKRHSNKAYWLTRRMRMIWHSICHLWPCSWIPLQVGYL